MIQPIETSKHMSICFYLIFLSVLTKFQYINPIRKPMPHEK